MVRCCGAWRDGGTARAPLKSKEGPARLVLTKGYSTTMALSTLNKLLGAQLLRSGEGVISTPESRRKERLFGATATSASRWNIASFHCINSYRSESDPTAAA